MTRQAIRNLILGPALVVGILLYGAVDAGAEVTVQVDQNAEWVGFVNVSDLPEDGGAAQFGSPWATEDLTATFSGSVLTLTATPIDDPSDFWYQGGDDPPGGPGAPGNKTVEANMYVEETGPLSGEDVTFEGEVLSNSLVDPYTTIAFIRDFAPDYSSFTESTMPLAPGPFSLSLTTDGAAGRHVQYGFQTVGPNVWETDLAGTGQVEIGVVPEPASLLLVGIGAIGLMVAGRRSSGWRV